jgi:non-lysosomal glucosylceramidase
MLAGFPSFRRHSFEGTFPTCQLTLTDPAFPAEITLTAFNPFIPLRERESGLPVGMFEFRVRNLNNATTDYTLMQSVQNPTLSMRPPRLTRKDGLTFFVLGPDADAESVDFGELAFGTSAEDVSWQHAWYRGSWFDPLEVYWQDLMRPGPLRDRRYDAPPLLVRDHSTLAARLSVPAQQTRSVRFIIAWYYPNCEKYWMSFGCARLLSEPKNVPRIWKNFYATEWANVEQVVSFAFENWSALERDTLSFRDALYGSSLPACVLDAIGSTISVLKSPTVLRLHDGTLYGWEGCHPKSGACEGSCTHVWNYQQALPFLYPALERSMRTADYNHNQDDIGGMAYRLQLPLGIGIADDYPCADGQFGGVMKVYRDWKIGGDDAWLRSIWPKVKKEIEYAWHPENEERWDPEMTGVLWGRQHHTLDFALYGPNSWLTGFYLGALKAGSELAQAMGDHACAAQFAKLFKRGASWIDQNLFNGEYFQQKVDLGRRDTLKPFPRIRGTYVVKGSIYDLYWSKEHKEIKYQVGEGCIIDQVLAQWHASLYGLGELFNPKKTKAALQAVMRYNFKSALGELANPCRVFGIGEERGTLICTWPNGVRRPAIPIAYAQETMHGYEYAFGTALMQCGLIGEGVTVFRAVRDRYDGKKRNPWNEIECGSNYSRSMSSYSALLVLSGFSYDLTKGFIGFAPKVRGGDSFRCFWSVGTGWGTFSLADEQCDLCISQGQLALKKLGLPIGNGTAAIKVQLNGRSVAVDRSEDSLLPCPKLELKGGDTLVVSSPALKVSHLPDANAY